MFAYDLKHNIVFDNAALFFKYNVYRFKQNAETPVFETRCFYDDESEIVNACIEFGFEHIMEFDVLEQLMQGGLESFKNSNNSVVGRTKALRNGANWTKWSRLFKLKDNELRSISVLPCYVKNDEELLSRDQDRLADLRSIVEHRLVGGSRFLRTLEYLLKLFIVDLSYADREDASQHEGAFGSSSPESLLYFFLKKTFVRKLYGLLTNDKITARNEIGSAEELESFLNERTPFIKYEKVELDQEDYARYAHLVEEDEEEGDFDDSEDDSENEDAGRRFKKIRTSDLVIQAISGSRSRDQRIIDEDEEENDDEPTDYNDSEEGEGEEEKDGRSQEETDGSTTKKRKRTIKMTVSNVHKDCFLFSDSFFLYVKESP